jgi:hypothetical protein
MTAPNANALEALAGLLQKNNIQYGTLAAGTSFKGFDYVAKKDGDFVNEGYTLAVNAAQAHGVLARVLLEPITQVNDSNTYDITTWSLPYAYGVHGYASKEKLAITAGFTAPKVVVASTEYGYVIPYNSFKSARVLAQLLQKNIKVRYAEKAFVVDGKKMEAGTLIVLKTSNLENWARDTKQVCEQLQLEAISVNSGWVESGADFGSPNDKIINHAPKVGLFTGENVSALAAGEVWSYFEQQLNYPITQLNYSFISRMDINKYDVIIAPEGAYKDLNSKPIAEKLQAFVRKGGVFIAFETAAQQLSANADWGFKMKEIAKNDKADINKTSKYGDKVVDALQSSIPGAIYKVFLDASHPIGFGTNGIFFDLKQDMVTYEPSNEAWNVGLLKKESYMTGFAGVKARAALQEGVVIGVKEIGSGKLVYMADDPIFRNFWEGGKLILANAVFFNGK